MYEREADSSDIYTDDTRLRDWMTTEVSQILLDELPGIFGRIFEMMIVNFEERIIAFRTVEEIF